ncbi:MAG: hypothetical protein IMY87_06170 [Chloroflexi bacterium]|nr:hypothetical protein [Chloroflexota bacterium]
MPRGGIRPGAGAPHHNINALKSGRHSIQLRALILALIASPKARSLLLCLAKQSKNNPSTASKSYQKTKTIKGG